MAVMDIPLTQGKVARIDAEDWDLVRSYSWYAHRDSSGRIWYAQTKMRQPDGRRTEVLMHRLILGAPPGVEVDHKDHDGLHNCRHNLRLATGGQNRHNQRLQTRGKTSRYKGVSFDKGKPRAKPWRAKIMGQGRQIHLGYYATEWQAALTYNWMALRLFGRYACLNVPRDDAALGQQGELALEDHP